MDKLEFYKRLASSMDAMIRCAYRFTADSDKAEELLQETMLKALTNKDKYRSDDNFIGWLRTMMHHIYLNNLHDKMVYVDTNDIYNTFAGKSSYLDTSLDYKELRRLLATLPRELYAPFKLYVDGYKYEEIARELGLQLGTVKSRIFTARERLKAMLGDIY